MGNLMDAIRAQNKIIIKCLEKKSKWARKNTNRIFYPLELKVPLRMPGEWVKRGSHD